jgi:hypothetical protein
MRLEHLKRRQHKTTIKMIYMHARCVIASAYSPYNHIHVPTVPSPAQNLWRAGSIGLDAGEYERQTRLLRSIFIQIHITTDKR